MCYMKLLSSNIDSSGKAACLKYAYNTLLIYIYSLHNLAMLFAWLVQGEKRKKFPCGARQINPQNEGQPSWIEVPCTPNMYFLC